MTISQTLETQKERFGLTDVEVKRYTDRYARLTEEFAVPSDEALRSIITDIEKDKGLADAEGRRVTGNPIFPAIPVASLNPFVMTDADVCLKIVSLKHHDTGKLAYSGIGGDETGFVKFALTSGTRSPDLHVGKVFQFYGANLSEFNSCISLLLNKLSAVEALDGDLELPPFRRTMVRDLTPGIHDLLVKVVRLNDQHEKARYITTLADETGQVFAALWDHDHPGFDALKEGATIYIRHALCNVRQDGSISLDLQFARVDASDAEVAAQTGVMVEMDVTGIKNAEIVHRCSECRKILKREGLGLSCDTHGPQESSIEEVRVKVRLDDGKVTHTAFIGPVAIESLLGMTNDQALALCAKSPLKEAVLEPFFHQALFGRKVTLRCDVIGDLLMVQSGSFVNQQPAQQGQTSIQEGVSA